jgi:hypothetical protein
MRMVFPIKIKKEVVDVFNATLDGSISMELERFGLCQYDYNKQRIVSAVPAGFFEHAGLVDRDLDTVTPSETLMIDVVAFNKQQGDRYLVLRPEYGFKRESGVIVPYHTHPHEDQDFFSSKGGSHGDTGWSFGRFGLLLDIVVSHNARYRGINPPVCVTFNPEYIPYSEENLEPLNKTVAELLELDKQKGYEKHTHAELLWSQTTTQVHRTIDFIVEP